MGVLSQGTDLAARSSTANGRDNRHLRIRCDWIVQCKTHDFTIDCERQFGAKAPIFDEPVIDAGAAVIQLLEDGADCCTRQLMVRHSPAESAEECWHNYRGQASPRRRVLL